MRILFCIKALAAGPGGGAERILARISSLLAARGHEVSVLTFDRPGSEDFYSVSEGVNRIRLGIGRTTSQSGPLVTAARLVGIRKAAQQLLPDVVVAFMHSSFTVVGMALVGTDVPVIGSERTSYPHYRRSRRDRSMLLLAQPFLTKMTVNSAGVREGFPHFIRRRMIVIPNPVARASSLADPVGRASKTLLCVGGLRPEKDHETLVRAFRLVAGQHSDWCLRIVGDGRLRPRLLKLIKELALESRIELVEATASVEREYQRAQLFALPSIYEGFPNCLAEALAHGLPSIGFGDCPGTNELIRSGSNGMLVHGADRITGFAQGLDALMRSPEKRVAMSAAAVESIARYSHESIAEKWEELLRSVAVRPRA